MAKACMVLEISCCRGAMAVRMAGQPSSTTRSRCWSFRIACLVATPRPSFCAVGDPMTETSSGMLSSLRVQYPGDLLVLLGVKSEQSISEAVSYVRLSGEVPSGRGFPAGEYHTELHSRGPG